VCERESLCVCVCIYIYVYMYIYIYSTGVNPEEDATVSDFDGVGDGVGGGGGSRGGLGVVEAAESAEMPELMQGWIPNSSLWDIPPESKARGDTPKRNFNPEDSRQTGGGGGEGEGGFGGWEGDAEASKLLGILESTAVNTPGGRGRDDDDGGSMRREEVLHAREGEKERKKERVCVCV
jgi:hypothetical protein